VWTVTPGPFSPPITYVLECKWGLVKKRDLDDFINILRYSKEFGVSTPDGRVVKQGITGVFAGTAFNPHETVRIGDEELPLPSYAARLNIQLLKAADLNQRLHQRGVPKQVTIQEICRVARNEQEVRALLEEIWEKPRQAEKILQKARQRNQDIYELERAMGLL